MMLRNFIALLLFAGYCQSQSFRRYPGTKWCGLGNDAADFEDLANGIQRATDSCCREHDHCDKIIPPFQLKYSTFNWSLFPMVECSCDKKFYECLKVLGEDDPVANAVGVFYFDRLAKKCFNDPSVSQDDKQQRQQAIPSWSSGEWSDELIG